MIPIKLKKVKKPKYNNKKTETDGIIFDSALEAARYLELKRLEDSGEITILRRQVAFEIIPSVVLDGRKLPPSKYVADFTYWVGDEMVCEDVKGMATREYRLKRKMMKAFLGIEVREHKKAKAKSKRRRPGQRSAGSNQS